jgi:monoamine oxidase
MTRSFDVVVVGAGFAGVCAARDLADAGHSVCLLEAADRIGGRTYSRPFRGTQHLIELGGAWVNRDLQPHMRRELERYGVSVRTDEAPQHVAFFTGGELRPLPVPLSSFGDLERAWLHLYDASKRISTAAPVHQQSVRDLDVSADEFFAPLGLSQETRDVIYGLLAGYVGTDPAVASMLPVIAQTAAFGGSPYGFYSGMKERFVNGTRELIERMVNGSNIQLELSTPVTRIAQGDGGVTVLTEAGEELSGRACVVAVPTNVMRHIDFSPGLSDEKQAALAQNHVGRGHKFTMIVENVPKRPFGLGMSEFQMVTFGHELDDDRCILICAVTESIHDLDPLSKEDGERALRRYFPEARVLELDVHNWNADPLFAGVWRGDRPGAAFDFPRIMSAPEGRLVFAGADLDTSVWRIWMEGALNSGHEGAHRVRTMLGNG